MSDERAVAPVDAPVDLEPAGNEATPKDPKEATKPAADAQPADASQDSAPKDAQAADDGEPPPEGEEGTEGDGEKRRLSRWQREQRAKNRLRNRAENAEREAEELRRRLAAGNTQPARPDQPAGEADPEPKAEDYQNTIDPAGFHKLAHDAWKVRQAERKTQAERQQSESQQRQKERHQELVEDHQDREDEARERIPDYDKVLAASAVDVAQHVAMLILESEKSALVSYHLASHENELRAINRMSPLAAAKEIGRLEARLSLPQAKKTTQAPTPVAPPKGGGAAPPADIRKLAESDDITEYARARAGRGKARA